jgi:hypothetical protein
VSDIVSKLKTEDKLVKRQELRKTPENPTYGIWERFFSLWLHGPFSLALASL